MKTSNNWALVLAAGAGSRLKSLTTDQFGETVPKQFWSLTGGPSLLRLAMARAFAVAPLSRTTVVVAREHQRFWEKALVDLPPQNQIVQPENRGTAYGILLPLLHILGRDRDAKVVLLPSDHYVEDERALTAAIRQALAQTDHHITLLGVTPESADSELGYVLPDGCAMGRCVPVTRFVEKPGREVAAQLLNGGALWNSFILVAAAQTIVDLIVAVKPQEARCMAAAVSHSPSAVRRLYTGLGSLDFSKDVVTGNEHRLRVLGVGACGWTDLGTPERLDECLSRLRMSEQGTESHGVFSLAAASKRRLVLADSSRNPPLHRQLLGATA